MQKTSSTTCSTESSLDPDLAEFDVLPNCALVRLPIVCRVTGRSRASIYADISAGLFPPPRKIGKRASAWVVGDIRTWMTDEQNWRPD